MMLLIIVSKTVFVALWQDTNWLGSQSALDYFACGSRLPYRFK